MKARKRPVEWSSVWSCGGGRSCRHLELRRGGDAVMAVSGGGGGFGGLLVVAANPISSGRTDRRRRVLRTRVEIRRSTR